ncbi:egg cell-secreted protein 1.1-like [Amaranthus tricolor]|uniref:egg cell-secreted protein 1.1-like n=1 Tax=Amaranthus tricolor TaxID=29722 RepID=UPI00258713E4|nr:egg cell-secreted protein 1.1-like [Amaranthus tricolor]
MALTQKFLATILLAFTLFSFTGAKTRPLMIDFSPIESQSYINRLNLDEKSTNCWDSLLKLQSCSGELIQFFYNGETYLGSDCCNAIIIIVQDCWPVLLGSLGLSSEEIDVLKGYCDAEKINPGPNPPSPPIALAPTKVDIMD